MAIYRNALLGVSYTTNPLILSFPCHIVLYFCINASCKASSYIFNQILINIFLEIIYPSLCLKCIKWVRKT